MRRQPKTFTLNEKAIKAINEESKKQNRTRSQIVEMMILEKFCKKTQL